MGCRMIATLLCLSAACSESRAADACVTQISNVHLVQSRIEADKESIRKLNTGLSSEELQSWAEDSEEKRREILTDAFKSAANVMIGDALDRGGEATKEIALSPVEIGGVRLQNGLGSLNPPKANAIISSLKAKGVSSETPLGSVLISTIRKIAIAPDKKITVEMLSELPSRLHEIDEATTPLGKGNYVESAAGLFQLVASMVGKGTFATAIGSALFQGSENIVEGLVILHAVNSLSNASESQLNGVATLGAKLQTDVNLLKNAQAGLGACQAMASAQIPAPSAQAKPRVKQYDPRPCNACVDKCNLAVASGISCVLACPCK